MRIARRTVLVSAAATLAAPVVLRFARADAPTVLKLHHFMSSVSSGHDKFLVPWARKIEAESGGKLRIDLFPSMQLGGPPAQLFDQVRDGTVDIAWTMPALTSGRFPKIEMFDLPFVPSHRALVSTKALEDFAATNLKEEFGEVHPLSFSCGDRAVVHTTIPVRTIEDIKDLKLHAPTRFGADSIRLLGAQPVPMPLGQLPTAITAHIVDGCVDPWYLVPPLRLNDVLKMHTEFSDSSLSSTSFVLVMNKDAYDRLPRDLKTVIDNNSGQAAANFVGAMWDLQAAAVADMVAQRGDTIVTLLPDAVARWRKATEPVIATWLKEMKDQKVDGAKLLAQARALLTKYANLPEPQTSQTASPPEQQAATDPQHSDVKPDMSTRPRGSVPVTSASSPPSVAPSPPAPQAPAKPVPPASPPQAAAHPPATATPTQAPPPAKPVAPPQPSPTVVKPAASPPSSAVTKPAVAPPSPPAPAPTPPPAVATAPSAPLPTPPAAAPIVPKPAPPPATPLVKPPPKTIDIPL
ncbi:MAG TPA: TRAP transporter substrate-binding protein [Xanthobacteraceae bacterium]|jgi:TRAP-type C4-dicarboxylate transport system substrate-binding protein|nr:TRAP transporter substrate-binding protein [Xanthobacteraceae bacterium]